MANTTNIKNLLGHGEMVYDTLFTEGNFQWFKSNEDAYIYVRNTETGRCSRYNAEAWNGKRISSGEFESKMNDAMHRAAEENGNDLTEEMIENALREVEESMVTEEGKQIAKELAPVEVEPAVINEFGCVDCRNCPVTGCVHKDCMRRNPTSVGGLGECPRLKVKKQEAPKKKRTRKSKDIAYEGHEVTLTAKQVDFIRHLSDTSFWERGLDSALWTDVLADEIGGQFAGKPMTTGAMISTICEKGLASRGTDRVNGRKATFMVLTELGKKVAAELGLN